MDKGMHALLYMTCSEWRLVSGTPIVLSETHIVTTITIRLSHSRVPSSFEHRFSAGIAVETGSIPDSNGRSVYRGGSL